MKELLNKNRTYKLKKIIIIMNFDEHEKKLVKLKDTWFEDVQKKNCL